jgi:hypothetical protein
VPAGLPERVNTLDEIEEVALQVRSAWGLGQNPVPVLTDMLEERGILVFQCEALHDGKLAVPLMDFHALRNMERADAAAYQ